MNHHSPRTILVAHPSPELYGSDRVLIESVAGLSARGFRVAVTLPKAGPLVPALEAAGAQIEIMSVPVLRKSLLRPRAFAGFMRDSVQALIRGYKFLSRQRPDAVVVNTVTIPLWILSAWLRRIPVLLHVHESERNAPRALRLALALPGTLCSSVVFNSEYSAETLTQAAPWLRDKTTIIYNGVPGPDAPTAPRAALDGRIRVLFVGRLSERKGAHVALEALMLLQERGVDIQLDLLGAAFAGYEWFEQQLKDRAAALPDPSRVNFLGFDTLVWPHYTTCDIAIVPSTMDEAFGNTAVEAVLAQRPVVVSRIGGLPEAVRELDSAVLVTADDAVALADGISSIISNWEEFRERSAVDSHEAAQRYDPQVYGNAFADQVQGIVPGSAV